MDYEKLLNDAAIALIYCSNISNNENRETMIRQNVLKFFQIVTHAQVIRSEIVAEAAFKKYLDRAVMPTHVALHTSRYAIQDSEIEFNKKT